MVSTQDYYIYNESSCDKADSEALLDMAFGVGRYQRTVNLLRANIVPVASLCFMVRAKHNITYNGHNMKEDSLLGMIRYYAISAESGAVSVMLGPLAIHPILQGLGLGKTLVTKTLHIIDTDYSYPAIFIVGNPLYYQEFGFNIIPDGLCYLLGDTAPLKIMARTQDGQPLPILYHGQLHYCTIA